MPDRRTATGGLGEATGGVHLRRHGPAGEPRDTIPAHSSSPPPLAVRRALRDVGAQVQTWRKLRGLTQNQVADRAGIDRKSLMRVERGDGGVSFQVVLRVLYALGVLDDLPAAVDPYAPETGVPSLLDLPALLGAAARLERDEESEEELGTLLRGGSSLGGARPKAHVLDDAGHIAIANFPSPANDNWDVMRWEAVALTLARNAGICVPRHELQDIDGRSVLIIDR